MNFFSIPWLESISCLRCINKHLLTVYRSRIGLCIGTKTERKVLLDKLHKKFECIQNTFSFVQLSPKFSWAYICYVYHFDLSITPVVLEVGSVPPSPWFNFSWLWPFSGISADQFKVVTPSMHICLVFAGPLFSTFLGQEIFAKLLVDVHLK